MAFLSNGVDIKQGISGSGWSGYDSSPAGTINHVTGNYYYHNTTQHAGGSAVGGYAIPLGVRKIRLTVDQLNMASGGMTDPFEIGLMISTGSSTQTSGYYGMYQLFNGAFAATASGGTPGGHSQFASLTTAIFVPWGTAGFDTNFTMECTRCTAWTGITPNLVNETANARWNINYWGNFGARNGSGAITHMLMGHFVQTALSGGHIRGFQIKTKDSVNTSFTFDNLSVQWEF